MKCPYCQHLVKSNPRPDDGFTSNPYMCDNHPFHVYLHLHAHEPTYWHAQILIGRGGTLYSLEAASYYASENRTHLHDLSTYHYPRFMIDVNIKLIPEQADAILTRLLNLLPFS